MTFDLSARHLQSATYDDDYRCGLSSAGVLPCMSYIKSGDGNCTRVDARYRVSQNFQLKPICLSTAASDGKMHGSENNECGNNGLHVS
jgi:hypothetical protein